MNQTQLAANDDAPDLVNIMWALTYSAFELRLIIDEASTASTQLIRLQEEQRNQQVLVGSGVGGEGAEENPLKLPRIWSTRCSQSKKEENPFESIK